MEKVNEKTGRKELHMINTIWEKANDRKELNDVKISHFSYLTSAVTVPSLYGCVQNDVLCYQQLHNINYNIKSVHYRKPELPARPGLQFISLLFCFFLLLYLILIVTYYIHILRQQTLFDEFSSFSLNFSISQCLT